MSAQDVLRRALVVDSLAGGPGVFTDYMRAHLARHAATLETPGLFRELERLSTSEFLAGTFDAYWDAIDRAQVDVLSISVGAWGDTQFSFRGAVHDLGEWHRRFQNVPRLNLLRTPGDLLSAHQAGRTGILLGFQNCTQLDDDLRNLETFHGLGVRMIQLTYNGPSPAGVGCTSPDDGLTDYGRRLIHAMNDLGIIVDVSHCGPRTTMEAIKVSRAPVAVSHSACQAVHRHARNKDDDVLRALRDTGGYFGVCAVPAFLADHPDISAMIRHIGHVLNVAGPDTVGIGSDWGVADSPDVLTRRLQAEARARGFRDEDAFDFTVRTAGWDSWCVGFPNLAAAMIDAGFPDDILERILGRNFLDFFHQVEHAAHRT